MSISDAQWAHSFGPVRATARIFRNIVGPSAVMAAGTMGAGAVASFILAGAWFRYELLWVIPLMLPIFVISVDSSSRIGALTRDKGMFSLIRGHINPGLAWLLLVVIVPVHLLIIMGQFSVMTSALMSLVGIYPPERGAGLQDAGTYHWAEIALSIACAVGILWLILSQGYQRMQQAMSLLMVMMFFCFLFVALRGFSEYADILRGFVPRIPADLPVPGTDQTRIASGSIIAVVGSAIAPAALLGIPYMSSDADHSASTLQRDLRRSIINLGVIFGAYAIFIMVAGGFALYPLPDHASIDAVHEAGRVLLRALPDRVAFVGPGIFAAGVFMAAMTTLVVAAQVSVYFCLDMVGANWRFCNENRTYHRLLAVMIVIPALLAPFWSFPALLKVVLLMGINVLVIPVVFLVVIYLVNQARVMGDYRAGWWRNLILFAGLGLSILLAVVKVPDYLQLLEL